MYSDSIISCIVCKEDLYTVKISSHCLLFVLILIQSNLSSEGQTTFQKPVVFAGYIFKVKGRAFWERKQKLLFSK